MLFNSNHFLIFLLLVVPAYFLLQSQQSRKILLLLASLYFYMVFSVPYVLLIMFSATLDYLIANQIYRTENPTGRRALLIISLVGNLGLLFFFKYYNFAAYSLAALFGAEKNSWVVSEIILPMGISFYTFETISYTIDVYKRVYAPRKSFLDYSLYITFFPHLVAGPIMRANDLIPQFDERQYLNLDRIQSGLGLAVWGLAKKSLIADPMGKLATEIFGTTTEIWKSSGTSQSSMSTFSSWAILMGTLAFTVQIYCDFSGYTDVARGVARMLGFRLMLNFDRPYLATSIRDFWRRWHISLSTWLRDYLYVPLGGNRKGSVRTYANLMTTMLLGGLWHGANWTFVVWGAIQGGLMSLERALGVSERASWRAHPIQAFGRWAVTFVLVCISWIFFRSRTIQDACDALRGLWEFRPGREISSAPLFVLMLLLGVQAAKTIYPNLLGRVPYTWPFATRWVCYFALLLLIILYAGSQSPDFLYFQF